MSTAHTQPGVEWCPPGLQDQVPYVEHRGRGWRHWVGAGVNMDHRAVGEWNQHRLLHPRAFAGVDGLPDPHDLLQWCWHFSLLPSDHGQDQRIQWALVAMCKSICKAPMLSMSPECLIQNDRVDKSVQNLREQLNPTIYGNRYAAALHLTPFSSLFNIHTHACTHTDNYTCDHKHTQAHAHTHTHTHT